MRQAVKRSTERRRSACLCPRYRDDVQRHTGPGAAGVYEGAEPPVSKWR